MAALEKGKFNVLGHPGGMSLLTYKEFPLDFFEELISGCKKNNIAFELNSSYHLSVLRDLKILLRKYDVFVSLGSDAHKTRDIGSFGDTSESILANE